MSYLYVEILSDSPVVAEFPLRFREKPEVMG
jgi:hypothetical protein